MISQFKTFMNENTEQIIGVKCFTEHLVEFNKNILTLRL
jgi:hypothetical protein